MTTMLAPAYQALFAAAALLSSAFAVRAAVTRDARVGEYLLCTGSSALAFLITVPDIPFQFPTVALLLMIAGVVLAPRHAVGRSVDLSESTLTRRNR